MTRGAPSWKNKKLSAQIPEAYSVTPPHPFQAGSATSKWVRYAVIPVLLVKQLDICSEFESCALNLQTDGFHTAAQKYLDSVFVFTNSPAAERFTIKNLLALVCSLLQCLVRTTLIRAFKKTQKQLPAGRTESMTLRLPARVSQSVVDELWNEYVMTVFLTTQDEADWL